VYFPGASQSLQVAYDQLYKECFNDRKKNKSLLKKLNTTENENVSLCDLLATAYKSENSLRDERKSLCTRLFQLNGVVDRLKVEKSLLLNRSIEFKF
jgi:hypothetical protein